MKTGKQQVLELLGNIPEDASLEDIQYQLYVRQKVQRGLDDLHEGRVLTQEQVERRMEKWLDPSDGPM